MLTKKSAQKYLSLPVKTAKDRENTLVVNSHCATQRAAVGHPGALRQRRQVSARTCPRRDEPPAQDLTIVKKHLQ